MPETLEEMVEAINTAAEAADAEVRVAEQPSTVWLKCFQEKLLRVLEERYE